MESGIADLSVVTSGYVIPDAIAVISDDDFLIADRHGSLYRYAHGEVTEIEGIPESAAVDYGLVLGGLLDVSLHPAFDENGMVYVSYLDQEYGLSVARFVLRGDRANDVEVIFASSEFSIGSRIAWEDRSHLFVSFGIGGDPYPEPGPQDLKVDAGKIHRLQANGGIPADNPVMPGATGPSSIWSYGHRNPQGLVYDSVTRTLYETEHGPMGGDELNVITAGGNYGWPLFSYGLNYDGTRVSDMTATEAAGFSILPEAYWGPDFRVGPSSLLLVSNSPLVAWNGSFLVGALFSESLIRYDPVSGNTEVVIEEIGRVRDIAETPNGTILLAVEAGTPGFFDSGRIIALRPRARED